MISLIPHGKHLLVNMSYIEQAEIIGHPFWIKERVHRHKHAGFYISTWKLWMPFWNDHKKTRRGRSLERLERHLNEGCHIEFNGTPI